MSAAAQSVREDFLDEDTEIPSQRIVLLSFLSPEAILQQKDKFFFQKFLEDYEVDYKVKGLERFLGTTVLQINRKLDECADAADRAGDSAAATAIRGQRVAVDGIMDQYQNFLKQSRKEINQTTIKEAYNDFLFRHQQKLDDEFHAANGFQTTMRGLKIRGCYATSAEAEARAKKLMRLDPSHNILLGEVGKWLPWDPNPNAIKDQEYAEDQLNQLMQNYKKNEQSVEEFYKLNNLKRPEKKVVGGDAPPQSDENSITAGHGSIPADQKAMFDQVGDLALQRKIERSAAE